MIAARTLSNLGPGYYLGHGIKGLQNEFELWGIDMQYVHSVDELTALVAKQKPVLVVIDLDHHQSEIGLLINFLPKNVPLVGFHSTMNENLIVKMIRDGLTAVIAKIDALKPAQMAMMHGLSRFAANPIAPPVAAPAMLTPTLPFVEYYNARVVLKSLQVVGGLDGARLTRREFQVFMFFAERDDQDSLPRAAVEKAVWGRNSTGPKDRLRRTVNETLARLNTKIGGNHFKIHD